MTAGTDSLANGRWSQARKRGGFWSWDNIRTGDAVELVDGIFHAYRGYDMYGGGQGWREVGQFNTLGQAIAWLDGNKAGG